MSEFAENIVFVEHEGKHAWKRLENGSVQFTSELFDTLEAAQNDARLNINGTHAVAAGQESGASTEEKPVEAAPESAPVAQGEQLAYPAASSAAPSDEANDTVPAAPVVAGAGEENARGSAEPEATAPAENQPGSEA